MKIYRVKVTYETLICGESCRAVELEANRVIRDSDEVPEIDAVEITDLSELPDGWNIDCIPWGDGNPQELRLRDILAKYGKLSKT